MNEHLSYRKVNIYFLGFSASLWEFFFKSFFFTFQLLFLKFVVTFLASSSSTMLIMSYISERAGILLTVKEITTCFPLLSMLFDSWQRFFMLLGFVIIGTIYQVYFLYVLSLSLIN